MGGQTFERREILRYIAMASVAGTFPGFSRWAFACGHPETDAQRGQAPPDHYKPIFFSQPQFSMIECLAEMIIPTDNTPGAKEAGVAEFIDFMVANRVPVTMHYRFRTTQATLRAGSEVQVEFVAGLDWLNARTKSGFGSEFLNCSTEQQNATLEELAYKSKYKPGTESGRQFFNLMRDYTVVGYYTTKIGLQTLGYPGLRTMWPKMPGCSHPNDPEHACFQEPAATAQEAFSRIST